VKAVFTGPEFPRADDLVFKYCVTKSSHADHL
jgi:hypothetical protein